MWLPDHTARTGTWSNAQLAGWTQWAGRHPFRAAPGRCVGRGQQGHFIVLLALLIAWGDTRVDICVKAVPLSPFACTAYRAHALPRGVWDAAGRRSAASGRVRQPAGPRRDAAGAATGGRGGGSFQSGMSWRAVRCFWAGAVHRGGGGCVAVQHLCSSLLDTRHARLSC